MQQAVPPVKKSLLVLFFLFFVFLFSVGGPFSINSTYANTLSNSGFKLPMNPTNARNHWANSLVLKNDYFTLLSGGGTTDGSVLDNDRMDNLPADPSQVILTIINTGTLPPSGFTLNANGSITVDSSVYDGFYTFTYQSCEKDNPSNCSTAEVGIEVGAVCTQPVNGVDFSWVFDTSQRPDGSEVSENLVQPASNYGYTFDIFKLDNSFNMRINGIALASGEIQFQQEGTPGINIEFEDGTQYAYGGHSGVSGYTQQVIWEMDGTVDRNPVVRVVISPMGNVSLYGSKVSNGPLFPLQLKTAGPNRIVLNDIVWNNSNENEIVVTQTMTGPAEMQGTGYGTNLIPCSCPDLIANQPDPLPEQCAGGSQIFNLSSLKAQVNDTQNVKITFHKTPEQAREGVNEVLESFHAEKTTTLYIRVYDEARRCLAENLPTTTLTVFEKPKLLVQDPIILNNCFGNTVYNLEQDREKLVDHPEHITALAYFTEAGQELTEEQMKNYDAVKWGLHPYLRISYNDCEDFLSFDLQQYDEIKPLETHFSYCEVDYPLEEVKQRLYPGDFELLDADGSPITADFDLSAQQTFTVIIRDKQTGCLSDPFEIEFEPSEVTPVPQQPVPYELCDAEGDPFDGVTTVDLTTLAEQINPEADLRFFTDEQLTQEISDPEQFRTSGLNSKVYILAEDLQKGLCPAVAELDIHVKIPVKAQGLLSSYNLCYGEPLEALIENDGDYDRIEWKDASGKVVAIGAHFSADYDELSSGGYQVTLLSKNGCTYTESFSVSKSKQPHIDRVIADAERIEVFVSGGDAPYEYSFDDGETWTEDYFLLNPQLPRYTIWVRNKTNVCMGEPVGTYIVKAPNVITPNDDGKNDTWAIQNIEQMEAVEVTIADRYGNTLYRSTDPQNISWDGKQNGRPLPTDTYWYLMKWQDPETGEAYTKTGWILLKNR